MDQQEIEQEDLVVDQLSDSVFYRMYLADVRSRRIPTDEAQLKLYEQLLAGENVMEQILESWLMRIVEISKFYKHDAVHMEDVIQEGNMGLWIALTQLPEGMKAEQMESYLTESVKNSMENYIREITGSLDQVNAIVGKAALLYEAREYLAKENAESPSLRQLSEYTHLPVDEISDILALFREEEA